MDSIVLVGLNHQTAPIALRERFAGWHCGSGEKAGKAAAAQAGSLNGLPGIHGSVLLSTCNRLEIYAAAEEAGAASAGLQAALAALLALPAEQLRGHLYLQRDRAAVEHLLRVAAGVDSMVLGEPQILGQVAHAHAQAREAKSDGVVLRRLFARAVRAGKRARNETAISRFTTSVSHAAVQLARNSMGELRDARVLVVGAGEMAEQAAAALRDEGVSHITCLNRTYEHAERFAHRFAGRALSWPHLAEALADAEIVIAATGAPHTVIYREDVEFARTGHEDKRLVILDIAVPRNVGQDVRALAGVTYYDIDDIKAAIGSNRAQREAALPHVEAIVQQEADDFFRWLRAREVVPALVEVRQNMEAVAQSELELALRRLDEPDSRTAELMALLTHRLVRKFLHEPTVWLKGEAADGNGEAYAQLLREMFGFQEPEALHGQAPASRPVKK